MKKIIILVTVLSSLITTVSCSDDFTDPQLQQNEIIEDTPITTLEQLQTFMNGTYALMRVRYYYGCDYIVYGEVRGSDEMFSTGTSGRYLSVSQFTMNAEDSYSNLTWRSIYRVIANANIVINATITDGSSEKSINEIKSQAYAVRAWAYFDLIKLYGQKYTQDKNLGVPIILDYIKDPASFSIARSTLDECYAQIESDFQQAYDKSEYSLGTKQTLTKGAIAALMSRYYLYKEDYKNVYKYASEVTNQYAPIDKGLYVTSWRIEGLNSIFELAYGVSGSLGTAGIAYIFSMDGYANTRVLPSLVDAYDPEDIRATIKKGEKDKTGMLRQNSSKSSTYLEGKYPVLTGEANQKLIRYEEVALNQVEAILMGGGGSNDEALNLINGIREQRGIAPLTSVTMDDLKEERRKELVGEGFRVWDLLRWNKSLTRLGLTGEKEDVLSEGDYRLAFPIPRSEVDNNPGLSKQQNKGY
ncbi:MAG: RagB/SusD family nutrient uptake outer membrane protein [Apibacter sp.]|uniref:RagB/SusD family nutrient uptake outer membrane protein n=1 Tax=Apibacter sp. TaxID=2023709 RepID=UPI0025EF311A|nr:RagB/SusD family nutrient uptake outer membrane protein [Apibacter sp.]MCT6868376.1 RagB/SusD family nutrient uptake outer membrane protein [Apibacter sp.]